MTRIQIFRGLIIIPREFSTSRFVIRTFLRQAFKVKLSDWLVLVGSRAPSSVSIILKTGLIIIVNISSQITHMEVK